MLIRFSEWFLKNALLISIFSFAEAGAEIKIIKLIWNKI